MRLYQDFHAVKGFGGVKTASDTLEAKLAMWANAKRDNGDALGLAKAALALWSQVEATGIKTAASLEARTAWAASFASALVVDLSIEKMAASGELDAAGASKLSALNAEAAYEDLCQLTKSAGVLDSLKGALKAPQVRGALAGAAVGGGLGAWKDDENRARGAVAGAVPGAVMGGLLGHGYHQSISQPKMDGETAMEHGKAFVKALQDSAKLHGHGHVATILEHPGIQNEIAQDAAQGLYHVHENLRQAFPQQDAAWHMKTWLNSAKAMMGQTGKQAALDLGTQMPPQGQPAPQGQPMPQGASTPGGTGGAPPAAPPAAPGGAPSGGVPGGPPGGAPVAPGGSAGVEGVATDPGPGGHPAGTEQLGQNPEEAAMQQQAQQQEQMAKEMATHNATVDNLRFMAEQVGLPSMAADIDATRDELVNHFAAGNTYLPHSLQKYFPQSQHAEQFIQKYKQRFAPLTGGSGGGKGGSKKAASVTPFWLSMMNRPFDLA